MAYNWHAHVLLRDDGSVKRIYAVRAFNEGAKKCTQSLHRFILDVTDPAIQVDHRDHDGLNCTNDNLRIATKCQNQWNQRLNRLNTSGYKGVSWNKKHWIATITINSKATYLGGFASKEAAARAYDAAAREYFGEFACLNFAS